MSEAKDRLQKALASLVADAADLALAHADLHAEGGPGCWTVHGGPGTTGSEGEAGYTVAADTTCRVAHVGPGKIRVGVPPPTVEAHLAPLTVLAVPAGQTSTATYPASTSAKIGPGTSDVEVAVPATLPVGVYVGRVTDDSGSVSSPFVVYVDGVS